MKKSIHMAISDFVMFMYVFKYLLSVSTEAKSYLSDISLPAENRFKYFLLLPEALSGEEV